MFTKIFLASTLFQAYTGADSFGKLIFWALFLLSLISWMVMVHKIRMTRTLRKRSLSFAFSMEKHKDSLLVYNPEKRLLEDSPYGQIFGAVKEKSFQVLERNRFFIEKELHKKGETFLTSADISWISNHVDTILSSETKNYEKNLFVLPLVVTLAPFLGLLGTVWGILVSFSHLQGSMAAGGNASILSGLAMALGATIVGLVVAIPALIGHNYIKSEIKDLCGEMEIFSQDLIGHIELQYRKVEIS